MRGTDGQAAGSRPTLRGSPRTTDVLLSTLPDTLACRLASQDLTRANAPNCAPHGVPTLGPHMPDPVIPNPSPAAQAQTTRQRTQDCLGTPPAAKDLWQSPWPTPRPPPDGNNLPQPEPNRPNRSPAPPPHCQVGAKRSGYALPSQFPALCRLGP